MSAPTFQDVAKERELRDLLSRLEQIKREIQRCDDRKDDLHAEQAQVENAIKALDPAALDMANHWSAEQARKMISRTQGKEVE